MRRCTVAITFPQLQKSWVSSLVAGLLVFQASVLRNHAPTEWSHSTHTVLMMKIIKVFGLESHNIRGSSRICWQNLFPWLSESVHRSDRREGDLHGERERWLDCFSSFPIFLLEAIHSCTAAFPFSYPFSSTLIWYCASPFRMKIINNFVPMLLLVFLWLPSLVGFSYR